MREIFDLNGIALRFPSSLSLRLENGRGLSREIRPPQLCYVLYYERCRIEVWNKKPNIRWVISAIRKHYTIPPSVVEDWVKANPEIQLLLNSELDTEHFRYRSKTFYRSLKQMKPSEIERLAYHSFRELSHRKVPLDALWEQILRGLSSEDRGSLFVAHDKIAEGRED